MKIQKLKKELRKKGAAFVRHGGSHEVWESRTGYMFTVPRHSDVKENTARAILAQADK